MELEPARSTLWHPVNYRRPRTSALDTPAKHWDQFALEVSFRQTVQEEVDGVIDRFIVIDRYIGQWMTKYKVDGGIGQ